MARTRRFCCWRWPPRPSCGVLGRRGSVWLSPRRRWRVICPTGCSTTGGTRASCCRRSRCSSCSASPRWWRSAGAPQPPRRQIPLTVACVMMLMALWIPTARARHAFDLAEMEQHYYRAGTAVAAHVTGTAAIVTLKDSGSVQYHAGRPTLSWDTLEPGIAGRGARLRPGARLHAVSAAGNRRGTGVPRSLPRRQRARQSRLASTRPGGSHDSPLRSRSIARSFSRTARCGPSIIRDAPVPSRDWRRWVGVR